MLPFLDSKKIVSVISARRGKSPDIEVNSEMEAPGQEIDPSLKSAAEDVLRAIDTKSVIDLAKALKSAFDVCDAEPQEEGEHTNEEGVA